MATLNEKCAELMKWFIDNKKESIPITEYMRICEKLHYEVLEELKNRNIGYRTTKALHTIKLEDAERWYHFYNNKKCTHTRDNHSNIK